MSLLNLLFLSLLLMYGGATLGFWMTVELAVIGAICWNLLRIYEQLVG
jgi:hypothetical protein